MLQTLCKHISRSLIQSDYSCINIVSSNLKARGHPSTGLAIMQGYLLHKKKHIYSSTLSRTFSKRGNSSYTNWEALSTNPKERFRLQFFPCRNKFLTRQSGYSHNDAVKPKPHEATVIFTDLKKASQKST